MEKFSPENGTVETEKIVVDLNMAEIEARNSKDAVLLINESKTETHLVPFIFGKKSSEKLSKRLIVSRDSSKP